MDRPSAWCACLAATRTTPDYLSGHRTVQPAIDGAPPISNGWSAKTASVVAVLGSPERWALTGSPIPMKIPQ
jgi:hypothetical protein